MKRVLFILAILLLPLAAMAMSPVSDKEMAGITGQSGVTIDISELKIGFEMDTVTWGDYDGFSFGAFGTITGQPTGYTAAFESADQYIGTQTTVTGAIIPNGTVGEADWTGYINLSFADLVSHIAIHKPMRITFDVGTYMGQAALGDWSYNPATSTIVNQLTTTAIQITVSGVEMTMDAFGLKGIILSNVSGATVDYVGNVAASYYNAGGSAYGAPNVTNALGDSGDVWNPIDYYAVTELGTSNGNMGDYNEQCLGAFGFSGLRVSVDAVKVYIYPH